MSDWKSLSDDRQEVCGGKIIIYPILLYYQELEAILTYPDHEIEEDKVRLRALERIVQLIVDEMIDVNHEVNNVSKQTRQTKETRETKETRSTRKTRETR